MMGGSNMPAQPLRPLGQFSNRSATSELARVIPVFYGRQRFGGQFISDFFDIKAVSVSTGGKGGTSSGANYFASFAAIFGAGPGTKMVDLFFNGDSVYTDTTKIYAVSLKMANNVATFQTRNPHNLTTGQTLSVFYAFQPEFNGIFVITVVSPTQFQYTVPGSSIPTETATPQNGQKIYALVHLDPVSAGADLETSVTIPDFGTVSIGWGLENQPANNYLNAVSGVQHPTYAGQIRMVFHQIFLGFNQTNAQNIEAVFECIPTFAWMSHPAHALVDSLYGTCNPAVIVADRLLNKRTGLRLTEDDLNLPSFDAAVEYFFNAGIGFTELWDRADEVRSQIAEILEKVDCTLMPDEDGKLKLVIGQPPGAPVEVTEDEMSDLPNFPAEDWSQVSNRTYVYFVDSDAGWAKDYVTWSDTAGIFGKNRPEPKTIDCTTFINNRALANKIKDVFGPINALPKKVGTIPLIWDDELFDDLAPGNAFQLTYDLDSDLNAIYRVTARTIPDPAKPGFQIEVQIDRSYLYGTSASPKGKISSVGGNDVTGKNNVIQNPNVPDLQPLPAPSPAVIVELPVDLCPNNKPAIAALVTRSTQSDTAAQVWLGRNYVFNGTPPESYFLLANLTGFAFHGALTADFLAAAAALAITNPLPAEGAGASVVSGMAIKLDGVDLLLPDVCDFDALANGVLLFVGNEIMSIAESALGDSEQPGDYSLTVIRGRFGTPIEDHHAGDTVWIISLSDLKALQHPHFLAGNDGKFKLTIGGESLSDADPVDIVFVGNRWNFKLHFLAADASATVTADTTKITADQDERL